MTKSMDTYSNTQYIAHITNVTTSQHYSWNDATYKLQTGGMTF